MRILQQANPQQAIHGQNVLVSYYYLAKILHNFRTELSKQCRTYWSQQAYKECSKQ